MTPDEVRHLKSVLQQGALRTGGGAAAGGALGAYVDGTPEGAAWGALGGGLGGLGSMAFRQPPPIPAAATRYMRAAPPAAATGGVAAVGEDALRASAGLAPRTVPTPGSAEHLGQHVEDMLRHKTGAYNNGYSDTLALYGLEKEAFAPLVAAGARALPMVARGLKSLAGVGNAASKAVGASRTALQRGGGIRRAATSGWKNFAHNAPGAAKTLQTAGNVAKNPLVQTGAVMAAT